MLLRWLHSRHANAPLLAGEDSRRGDLGRAWCFLRLPSWPRHLSTRYCGAVHSASSVSGRSKMTTWAQGRILPGASLQAPVLACPLSPQLLEAVLGRSPPMSACGSSPVPGLGRGVTSRGPEESQGRGRGGLVEAAGRAVSGAWAVAPSLRSLGVWAAASTGRADGVRVGTCSPPPSPAIVTPPRAEEIRSGVHVKVGLRVRGEQHAPSFPQQCAAARVPGWAVCLPLPVPGLSAGLRSPLPLGPSLSSH